MGPALIQSGHTADLMFDAKLVKIKKAHKEVSLPLVTRFSQFSPPVPVIPISKLIAGISD